MDANPDGDAEGAVAVSGTGEADGTLVGVSGTRDGRGWAAVSGEGNATGRVAASATGDARACDDGAPEKDCHGILLVTVAGETGACRWDLNLGGDCVDIRVTDLVDWCAAECMPLAEWCLSSCAIISVENDAEADVLAVSGTGNASAGRIAVAGNGDATCSDGEPPLRCHTITLLGDGDSQGTAVAVVGDAHGYLAIAIVGCGDFISIAEVPGEDARRCSLSLVLLDVAMGIVDGVVTGAMSCAATCVVVAVTDDAEARVLAMSATGDADGSLVAISGTGDADGGFMAMSGAGSAHHCGEDLPCLVGLAVGWTSASGEDCDTACAAGGVEGASASCRALIVLCVALGSAPTGDATSECDLVCLAAAGSATGSAAATCGSTTRCVLGAPVAVSGTDGAVAACADVRGRCSASAVSGPGDAGSACATDAPPTPGLALPRPCATASVSATGDATSTCAADGCLSLAVAPLGDAEGDLVVDRKSVPG